MAGYDSALLPELLPVYYKRLFPFKPFVQWLSYSNTKKSSYFSLREFAFILKDDVYLRYRSFTDQTELENEMRKECPFKLDIGAVFNDRPKDHKKVRDFCAKERELVFDIDLTDYDDIRTCCSGGSMCSKCWRLMAIAVTLLDTVLKDHFGFNHRLWVYSGRRGVHCWVADEAARKLGVDARTAIAEYLGIVTGGEQTTKKVQVQPFRKASAPHPLLQMAYELIIRGPHMEKLVVEQRWLDDAEHWTPILKLCTDADTRASIEADLLNLTTPEARWRALQIRFDPVERMKLTDKLNAEGKIDTLPPLPADKWFLMEFVLQYTYPRLDVNVTTGLNHLLKSPFCVHPKTGKIAVPLDPRIIDKFDADSVPRIDRLLSELAEVKENQSDANRKALEYKRTSLAPFVETFESFVQSVVKEGAVCEKVKSEPMDF